MASVAVRSSERFRLRRLSKLDQRRQRRYRRRQTVPDLRGSDGEGSITDYFVLWHLPVRFWCRCHEALAACRANLIPGGLQFTVVTVDWTNLFVEHCPVCANIPPVKSQQASRSDGERPDGLTQIPRTKWKCFRWDARVWHFDTKLTQLSSVILDYSIHSMSF